MGKNYGCFVHIPFLQVGVGSVEIADRDQPSFGCGAGGVLFWGDAKPVCEGACETFVRVEDKIQCHIEHFELSRAQCTCGRYEPLLPDILERRDTGFGFEDSCGVKLRVARGFCHIARGDGLMQIAGNKLLHPLHR